MTLPLSDVRADVAELAPWIAYPSRAPCIGHPLGPEAWSFADYTDTDVDRAEHRRNNRKAAMVCVTECPFQRQCLRFGERTRSYGIWGGYKLAGGTRRRI